MTEARSAEHSQRITEALEDRCLLATIVWDGAPDGGGSSANADWTNGDNWVGDSAPSTNDDLVFPAGASETTNINNFVGESFGSILIEGDNYDLSGNSIILNGAITVNGAGNSVDINVQLGSSSGIANTNNSTFTMNGAIDVDGNNLSVSNSGSGEVELNGAISNGSAATTGDLNVSGNGTVVLGTANSYSGATLVTSGTLIVQDALSLGTARPGRHGNHGH
ncbi:MAG: hypothetical protein P8J37_15885 [Fuerstiella sp.]|nr:hypothetical protein [Fuerstiella sp.]